MYVSDEIIACLAAKDDITPVLAIIFVVYVSMDDMLLTIKFCVRIVLAATSVPGPAFGKKLYVVLLDL